MTHAAAEAAARDLEMAITAKVCSDLTEYAKIALKIRSKDSVQRPLLFNKAQQYIHVQLEEQRAKTGKVRAIILKGRQQGCSTYVAARFYHRVTHSRGCRVFILTHEDNATQNLFGMVGRYHENVPGFLRPSTRHENAKELSFDQLDSGYKVGTAGTKGVGRRPPFSCSTDPRWRSGRMAPAISPASCRRCPISPAARWC